MRFPHVKVIQDARELYLFGIKNSLKSNLGNLFERLFMKRAEIVICANEFRAEFMANHVKLKERPLVHENIRYLSDAENKIEEYREEYNWLISKKLPIVISTSGCSFERTNDRLVKEFKEWDEKTILLFVGGQTKEDEKLFRILLKKGSWRTCIF